MQNYYILGTISFFVQIPYFHGFTLSACYSCSGYKFGKWWQEVSKADAEKKSPESAYSVNNLAEYQ